MCKSTPTYQDVHVYYSFLSLLDIVKVRSYQSYKLLGVNCSYLNHIRCEWLNIPYKINVASVEVIFPNIRTVPLLEFGILNIQIVWKLQLSILIKKNLGVCASGQHGPHQPGGGGHHPRHMWSHHLHHHCPLQVDLIVHYDGLWFGYDPWTTNMGHGLTVIFQESHSAQARLVKINRVLNQHQLQCQSQE